MPGDLLDPRARRYREEKAATEPPPEVIEEQPPTITKLVAEPALYPYQAPTTEKELLEAGYHPATAEEQEHALQLAIREGVITYVPPPITVRETPSGVIATAKVPSGERTYYYAKKPSWKETTLTGQIYEKGFQHFLFGWLPKKGVNVLEAVSPIALFERFVPPLKEAQAGFFGIFESWVRPEVPTPIGAGVGYLLGKPKQAHAYKTGEVSPAYLGGGLVGTYFEAKVMGWALGKAWKGIKYVTPERIKEPIRYSTKFGWPAKLGERVRVWRVEHLPSWRGSRLDVWFAKQSKWYYGKTRGIAIAEVGGKMGPWVGTEPISYGKSVVAMGATEMTIAPRTGGIYVGKYFIEPVGKTSMKHLISRGGKISIGYLTEYSFRRLYPETGLTPLVSQTQLTRMGIYPYVPKTVSTFAKATAPKLAMGLATITLLKMPQRLKPRKRQKLITVPKLWQPTFALERVKYSPLEVPTLKPKKREKAMLIPRLAAISEIAPRMAPIEVPKQMSRQVPKLMLKQVPKLVEVPPTPTIPTYEPPPSLPPIAPPLAWPSAEGRGARRRGLMYGAWFYKKHPIESPERFAKKLMHGAGGKKKKPPFIV